MARITVLRNSWSVEATASSTNQAPDASASRMLSYQHSERWRTTNLTTMRATFDAGSALAWDTLFLGYTNATAAATLRVTSGDVSANLFTTPSYSRIQTLRIPYFGEFTAWHAWHAADSTQTYRYIGIEITDAANPDGFFSAGIAYIGTRLTPLLEANPGSGQTHEDLGIKLRMANGEMTARRRPRKASRPFEWSYLTEDEKEFFRNLARTWGASTPLVCKVQPYNPIYEHANIYFGYTDGIEVADLPAYAMMYNGFRYRNIGSAAFSLVEV